MSNERDRISRRSRLEDVRSTEMLETMRHNSHFLRFEVSFDDLNTRRYQVAVVTNVAGRKRFTLPLMPRFDHEKNLSIPRRREVEVIHSLVPHSDFGTRHVAGGGEVVGLALDQDRGILAAKIEPMSLPLLVDPSSTEKPDGSFQPSMPR